MVTACSTSVSSMPVSRGRALPVTASGADARTPVESSRQIASSILRKRIFIDSSSFPARGLRPGRVASYGCVSWETGGWYT